MNNVQGWQTAITRKHMSAPVQWLMDNGKFLRSEIILDYGCGRGRDVKELTKRGFITVGYDPYWCPSPFTSEDYNHSFDVVLCTYVLNVVLCPEERHAIISTLKRMRCRYNNGIYITVRRDIPVGGTDTQAYIDYEVRSDMRSVHHRKNQFEIYEVI